MPLVNYELEEIKKWFDTNKKLLILRKTKFILFYDMGKKGVSWMIDAIEIQGANIYIFKSWLMMTSHT